MSGDRLQSDGELFEQIFPQILQALTHDGVEHPQTADAIHRLREVMEYNVPGGKRNRGLSVLASFRALAGPMLQTQENIHRVLIVGWCVELLQAFFLVADDIMDQSITRRGRVCWYRKDGIGLDAINDSFLLEAAVYQLLRKYTKGQPYYLNLLELFLQTSYQTELGQALDLMTAPPGKVDLDRFTEQRYKAIVKYKTAYYSFYLPVAAAMYMAGIDGDEQHTCAKSILLEMGEFFQIQVNYGQSDPGKTARVKALYNELNLRGAYTQYEEQSYQRLRELITQHSITLPQDVFLQFAQKIYKREK